MQEVGNRMLHDIPCDIMRDITEGGCDISSDIMLVLERGGMIFHLNQDSCYKPGE